MIHKIYVTLKHSCSLLVHLALEVFKVYYTRTVNSVLCIIQVQ